MSKVEFRPGELFVYTKDGDCEHMELGQVARKVDDEMYACYYSTGDTAARTNVRNMRKLANAGWSHVERAGDDDRCEMEYSREWMGWHCLKCDNLRMGLENQRPKRCPECGRWVQ